MAFKIYNYVAFLNFAFDNSSNRNKIICFVYHVFLSYFLLMIMIIVSNLKLKLIFSFLIYANRVFSDFSYQW